MDFVSWVENSAMGMWMVDSIWAYPIVLAAHAVGMSIVVGTVLMIDIRLLGYVGNAPLDSFRNIFIVTLAGVLINFLSGVALFTSDPAKFLNHPVFWGKLGLMLSGVIVVYLTWRSIEPGQVGAGGDYVASRQTRILAWLSLLLWFSVIVSGRLVGYFEFD